MWSGVGGWRFYEWNQTRLAAQIGTQFENAIVLGDAGKHDEAEKIFARIAVDGTPAYRALARIRQAAQLAQIDAPAATETYRQISADSSVEQVLRDIASLRAAGLLIDAGSYRRCAQAARAAGAGGPRIPSQPRANCSRSMPGRPTIGRAP